MTETAFRVVVKCPTIKVEQTVTAALLAEQMRRSGWHVYTVTPMDDALIKAADVWDEAKYQFYHGPRVYVQPVDTSCVKIGDREAAIAVIAAAIANARGDTK